MQRWQQGQLRGGLRNQRRRRGWPVLRQGDFHQHHHDQSLSTKWARANTPRNLHATLLLLSSSKPSMVYERPLYKLSRLEAGRSGRSLTSCMSGCSTTARMSCYRPRRHRAAAAVPSGSSSLTLLSCGGGTCRAQRTRPTVWHN